MIGVLVTVLVQVNTKSQKPNTPFQKPNIDKNRCVLCHQFIKIPVVVNIHLDHSGVGGGERAGGDGDPDDHGGEHWDQRHQHHRLLLTDEGQRRVQEVISLISFLLSSLQLLVN